MTKRHRIETKFGAIEIQETDNTVVIKTPDKLNAHTITVYINTVWADCDLAVDVNGRWLKDAYAAGQHREPGNLED